MSWVERLVFYGKRVFKEVGEDDLSGAAGELAYRFFLALFPFFIFLAALGGFVADLVNIKNPTNEIMELMGDSLPSDAASVLRGELESVVNTPSATLLSLGIIAAIWSASSGVSTIVKGMNRIYEVKETRPLWKRYAMNVGLTVLGGLFVLGSIILLLVGQVAGTEVATELDLADKSATAVSLARWPIIVLMLTIATAFLYWAAPNVRLPFRWITPGAVIFIIGWLTGSFLFGLYVSNFGSYNATYGTLGGIVVLLIWLYLTSFLLMLGAEINAVLAQEEAPEKLPQTPEQGATSEPIPLQRREELIAQSRYGGAAVTKPRPSPLRAAPTQESSLITEEPDARPSKLTTVLALLVTALTLWRVASSSSKQK